METLQKQTSPFGEDELTSLQVVFPANHTAQQENGSEKQTNAIYGQKCLELYERYNHATSWGKTFMDLLIGTGDWFSTRCKLTWKLSDTKYNRSYFRLVPSTLPTEEKELGLLPTPTTQEITHPNAEISEAGRRIATNGNTHSMNLADRAIRGLIPTPDCSDRRSDKSRQWGLTNYARNGLLPTPRASKISGGDRADFSPSLPGLMIKGLLPTPDAASGKTGYMGKNRQGKQQNLETVIRNSDDSLTSQQLNPQFVGEMMGFPENWTALPFLNGETKV